MLYTYINRHAGTPKQRQKDMINLDTAQFCFTLGLGSDRCQHYYITILLPNKLQIDKAGDKVLLSDNYPVTLIARY